MHLGQYLVDRQTVLLITLNQQHLVSVQLLVNITLSITNNESQTLYFRKFLQNDTYYDYSTSSTSNMTLIAKLHFVPANSTLTYDASNSPNMRKLYLDGTYGYMQCLCSSYIESPDWTNTTAYPYNVTNGQILMYS